MGTDRGIDVMTDPPGGMGSAVSTTAASVGRADGSSDPTERRRADLVEALAILDTPAEPSFDRIVRMAASLFEVPIAVLSIADGDRLWFKARVGLTEPQAPRAMSFCGTTLERTDLFEVLDAADDPVFGGHPMVTEDPGVRFYAGVPLGEEGEPALGTLCIMDRTPRRLTERECELLRDLAAMALDGIRHRQETRRAQMSASRLTDAIESLPDGFVMFDADDRLVMCNRRYREFYRESGDIIAEGRRFEDIVREGIARGQYPDAVGREEAFLAERMERHLNPTAPVEQRLPGDRWLRIDERPTPSGGLVGFRIDITALKRQERALADLARDLEVQLTRAEEAQAAKVQFLASVSHELRTPLNAIIGFSQILGQELFGPLGLPKYLEYADDIQQSAQHLLSLVDDILDMAKLSSGKVDLAREPIPVMPVAHSAVKVASPPMTSKALDVSVQACHPEPTVWGDQRALRQVLINLLSNAAKFTPPHGKVTVAAAAIGDWVTITVSDTGRGIPPHILPKLAQPFQRVDNAMTSSEGGSGLGLAISRALVEGMGGRFEIESRIGAGTDVRVTLPAVSAAD